MLRIIYVRKKSDPFTRIIDKYFDRVNTKGNVVSKMYIEDFENIVDDLNLTYNHTLIIKAHDTGQELSRIDGLFDEEVAQKQIDEATYFLERYSKIYA